MMKCFDLSVLNITNFLSTAVLVEPAKSNKQLQNDHFLF